jgi:hypothetical protein
MSELSSSYFRFVASPEAIAAIQRLAEEQQVQISQPQPFDSNCEPLNASINPNDLMQIADIVTVVFTSGASALTFFNELMDLLEKIKQLVKVKREDDKSLLITPETDRDSIKDFLPYD